MIKHLLWICLTIIMLPSFGTSQPCQIIAVNATPQPCNNYSFLVTINLVVNDSISPGFTLAGNGVIYGTWLYSDLPVTVGPFQGDNHSQYEFIAWDVEHPECQNYASIDAADCGILPTFTNFTIDSIFCVTSGVAAVEIDFVPHNQLSQTFDLFNASGGSITTQLYTSLPFFLSNLTVNGADSIKVKLCDHNNAASCKTFTVAPIDCTPTNCEIYNVRLDPECLTSNFVVHLDFEIDHPASDSFTVRGNNINYGKFAYNELPIVLGPLNGNSNLNWEFIIQDKLVPSCMDKAVLGSYHCPPPCDILTMEAMALECNGNDAYTLRLDMEIEGEGDLGYSIFSDSYFYGTHDYDDLPLTIPDFAVGNFIDRVTVCDNEKPGCCATTPFEALLCNGCIIYNLEANPLPCNPEGQFYISINFDFQNTSSQGFTIDGNGTNYGNFSYDDVPVTLGPFLGNGAQFFEFVVTDLVNDLCFDATELGTLPCSAICDLSNLQVETGECTGNNFYILHVDFDHTGTTANGFDLYANGEYYDSYNYSDLPLTILEFPASGGNQDMINVCDNNNDSCCASLVFEAPDCQCSIFETTVETLVCTSDSTFAISVEFFSENLVGNSVDVYLDGLLLGTHNVNQIPFVVGNIPEGTGSAILTICSHEAGDCCDDVLIQLITCDSLECLIWDLSAEGSTCNSDTTYALNISFNHANLPVDSVNIWANDKFVGKFLVQPGFIHVEHFPVVGNGSVTIAVCAVGNSGCCDNYDFEQPDCTPNACEISGLVAVPGNCLTDSTYVLVIEYSGENIAGDSVTVTANGNAIDTFADPGHHIVIDQFPMYDSNFTHITLCSFANPDCCDTYTFETPHCDQCGIDISLAEAGKCQPDSTYSLAIEFLHSNLPTDSVIITANEETIGTYYFNDGHFTIEGFPVANVSQTTLQVCAQGAPDCCDEFVFATPTCGTGPCQLDNLFAMVGPCNSDSTYLLQVMFLGNNLPTDSVLIYANEHFIGTFHADPESIQIDSFPVLGGQNTNLTVCALGAPDCCDEFSFPTPLCDSTQCSINNITVQTLECSSDSTFSVVINFQFKNITGDGFDVYTGDSYLGFFGFDQVPIETNQFPANATGEYVVTICQSDTIDCCTSFEFEGPVCADSTCDIHNLQYTVTDCDSVGNFFIRLNFQYQFTGDSGFNVVGNGNEYGNFSYDQLPVTIGPFETGNTIFEFLVTDAENPACFDFIEPGIIDTCIIDKTTEISHDEIFQVLNNGSLPGILSKKDVTLSLFNSNGKVLIRNKSISAGTFFELNSIPNGVYVATIAYQGNTWPVKLVKASY